MRYSRSWTGLLVTLITLAGICLPVQAQEEEEPGIATAYGVLDDVNEQERTLVIDDRAMTYGAQLSMRDLNGTIIVKPADIAPGTAVRFTYNFRGRSFDVTKISVVEEIPPQLDEEGVSDR